MTKAFRIEENDGIRIFYGTANDLLKVIRDLEESGEAVNYYMDRPVLRTGRRYMLVLVLQIGTYTVYREA